MLSGDDFDLTERQDVVIGIRPSKLEVCATEEIGRTVSGIVDFIEFHGDHILVGLTTKNDTFTAFIDSSIELNEGSLVHFTVDESHIHLFDAKTERSLRKK